MSEQRIDTAGVAASGTDADPAEGQGLATDATQRSGEAAETDERREIRHGDRADTTIAGDGETEGERTVRAAEDAS